MKKRKVTKPDDIWVTIQEARKHEQAYATLEEIARDLILSIRNAYWQGRLNGPTQHMITAMGRFAYWEEEYATNRKNS